MELDYLEPKSSLPKQEYYYIILYHRSILYTVIALHHYTSDALKS